MDSKTLNLFGHKYGPGLSKKFGLCVLVAAGLVASAAEAVQPTVYQLGDGGAIAPHVRLEFGSDNNPLRAAAGSEGTMYLRLQPSVRYLAQQRNNRLTLGYSGDYYQYFEEYCQAQPGLERPGDCLQGSPTFDKASYQNHRLSLDGFLEVSKRLRARLELAQIIDHQPLGTGLSSNLGVLNALTSPDYWNTSTARAQLSYGAFQARGEVRVGVFLENNELNSERAVNLDDQSDSAVSPFGQLLYRVGSRTQLFAGIGLSQVRDSISFNDDGSINKNNERDISRYRFGVELDAEAVTSGSVSVSLVKEDFLANRDDLTYAGLDVDVTWRPRRFSTVTISGERETRTGGFDSRDLALTTSLGLDWQHFWKDRFSTRLLVEYEIDENIETGSEDRTTGLNFGGSYNVRRWFDIGGFIYIDTRAGSGEDRDYDRTVIGLTANGTI